MSDRIRELWQIIWRSFWFIPGVFALLAVALAWWLSVSGPLLTGWLQLEMSVESARTTLAALAGTTLGVLGTVFSITVVALSLTSQQYGPRLIRAFMDSSVTQFTVGVLLGTGLFCLLAIGIVIRAGGNSNVSVQLAVVFTIISMAVLIGFIHHISKLIQGPHIVAAVANDLKSLVDGYFPEPRSGPPDITAEADPKLPMYSAEIRSQQEGYIVALSAKGLVKAAANHEVILKMRRRPGDFLFKHQVLLEAHSSQSLDQELVDKIEKEVNKCIRVAPRRRPVQDVESLIHELVEIAVRSLSTGINDPFTAMSCIDFLGARLGHIARLCPARSTLRDERGALRVVLNEPQFAEYLQAATKQIRENSATNAAVSIHLVETLTGIASSMEDEKARQLLLAEAIAVREGAREFSSRDKEALDTHVSAFQDLTARSL